MAALKAWLFEESALRMAASAAAWSAAACWRKALRLPAAGLPARRPSVESVGRYVVLVGSWDSRLGSWLLAVASPVVELPGRRLSGGRCFRS